MCAHDSKKINIRKEIIFMKKIILAALTAVFIITIVASTINTVDLPSYNDNLNICNDNDTCNGPFIL